VTRYVAEATGADGSDVRLIFLETEPEGCRARRRAGREFSFSASASPATTSTVHQSAPVVRQREDLYLEVSARSCRLQQQTETKFFKINSKFFKINSLTVRFHILITHCIINYYRDDIILR